MTNNFEKQEARASRRKSFSNYEMQSTAFTLKREAVALQINCGVISADVL